MRAEKRKKNAPKELARLKTALGNDAKGEIIMKDISEIATVVPAEKVKGKPEDVDMEGGGELFTAEKLLGCLEPVYYIYVSLHLCSSWLSTDHNVKIVLFNWRELN